MHEKIFDFIKSLTSPNSNLYHGYWFAKILLERFADNGAVLMYSPPDEQFLVRIEGKLYNYTGDVTHVYSEPNFPPVEWAYWENFDSSNAARVMAEVFA